MFTRLQIDQSSNPPKGRPERKGKWIIIRTAEKTEPLFHSVEVRAVCFVL